jgi:hypothetical protein
MTGVVQHETKGAREARMKRCTDILAGKLQSVAFLSGLDLHNLQLGDARMADVFARLAEVESIERLAIGFNVLRRDAMKALGESRGRSHQHRSPRSSALSPPRLLCFPS